MTARKMGGMPLEAHFCLLTNYKNNTQLKLRKILPALNRKSLVQNHDFFACHDQILVEIKYVEAEYLLRKSVVFNAVSFAADLRLVGSVTNKSHKNH